MATSNGASGKRVCVVGAGASGLAALKECARQGLQSTCYEIDSDVGGLWNRKEPPQESNTPAVWDTLITNVSKHNMCYSDFPNDPNDPPFMPWHAVRDYFRRVVKHFSLGEHIQFNTTVVKIRKTPDHDITGQWEVYTCPSNDPISKVEDPGSDVLSKCVKEIFDYVMVCSGFFRKPIIPNIPGLESFQGKVVHSFSYYTAKDYEGEHVLLVGNKFSGTDIASDISARTAQTYLSLGVGTWIMPRLCSGGRPIEFIFTRSLLYSSMRRVNDVMISEAEARFDHTSSGIRPPKPPAVGPFGITHGLDVQIMSKQVKTYGRLVKIGKNEAYFSNGEVIRGLDTILFCTGFSPVLPFLEMDIIQPDGKIELFKMALPLNKKHNTIAFIGLLASDAPVPPICEAQARLVTALWTGKYCLPSAQVMQNDVEVWSSISQARAGENKKHSYFLPGFVLIDSIGAELGTYASFWKVFWRDPLLAYRNWYGPIFAAQHRLIGPDNKWKENRALCHRLYEEGNSSVCHSEHQSVDRPDVREHRIQTIGRLFVVGAGVFVSMLMAKYSEDMKLMLMKTQE